MRGFSLPTVIILSLILTIIGVTGIYIVRSDYETTLGYVRFNLAEVAANSGLYRAIDEIQATGFCSDQTISGNVGSATYTVTIKRSGRVCLVKSVGRMGPARSVKVSAIQSYYGIGLYTVRGGVNVEYRGGRLSGCDINVDPVCFVPAFIASGTVHGIRRTYTCSQDRGGPGVYGEPAILPNVTFHDLTPLFFNVNCFHSNSETDLTCDYGLNNALEDTYATNWINDNKDFYIDGWGQVIVNIPEPPEDACIYNGSSLNLADIDNINYENEPCDTQHIIIKKKNAIVYGTPPHEVILYTNRNIHLEDVDGGEPSGYNEFDFPNYNLTLYSTGRVYLDNVKNIRIVTNNRIYTYDRIQNSLIVQGLNYSEENNNAFAPQNLFSQVNPLLINNSVIFTRQIRFRDFSRNYILNSLVYLYANACPNCSRNSNLASVYACQNTLRRCGWAGRYFRFTHIVYLGRNAHGDLEASIVINVNSVVAAYANYIWGVYFGEDVNYLWGYRANVRGFLIRNFPKNLSLDIGFNRYTNFEFSKKAIDQITEKFWFFRKVKCIRDDINPLTQMIQSRFTAY